MPTVILGNPAALDGGRVLDGKQITTVNIPTDYTPAECLATIADGDGVWRNHSGASAPEWVESDDPDLAEAISAHYGCPIGRPGNGDIPTEEG